MPSSHLIQCRPLLLLPPIPHSIKVFSNESTLRMRWPKYWSFSLSISLSNEYPGMIFRMDWLDVLEVQGTSPTPQLKSINSPVLIPCYFKCVAHCQVRATLLSGCFAFTLFCYHNFLYFLPFFHSYLINPFTVYPSIHPSIHPSIIHLSSIHPSTQSSQTMTSYVPGSVLYTDSKEKRE